MKLITIFNFPDEYNYNRLCHWWLSQALENTDIPIEIWYRDDITHLNIKTDRVKLKRKPEIELQQLLPEGIITDKVKHNVGFKLYNLCQESEPFIFVDADAIILKNIQPLLDAAADKPFIAVDHQNIPGHTSHIPGKFLNSGVQVCSDSKFLDFKTIMKYQQKFSKFLYPGTDQSMLKTYFKYTGYDYTHPGIGFEWNHCAGVHGCIDNICINHYWYNFKPWNIDCLLWLKYITHCK